MGLILRDNLRFAISGIIELKPHIDMPINEMRQG